MLSSNRLFKQILKKQKYQFVGYHSAVKKCRWLHESLTKNRICYKQQFYGIESHRCLQMTPYLNCNFRCAFCWRIHPDDIDISPLHIPSWNDPQTIVEESLKAQRKILSGYKSHVITGRLSSSKYHEALHPRHAAISLDGEPTLYPMIGELIAEYNKREFTSFLVTNGSNPSVLTNLTKEPTQLYLSIYAPNHDTFTSLCKPNSSSNWFKVKETLRSLPSFTCPTVVRLTLVKGYNMHDLGSYIDLLKEAEPTYIEAKAYMYVGYSRSRLSFEAMPTYQDIQEFSETLAEELNYNIIGSSIDSRVLLLSRLKTPQRLV